MVRIFIEGSVLSLVTLGLYYTFSHNALWRSFIHHTCVGSHFGSQPFTFDGRGRDLFGRFPSAVRGGPLLRLTLANAHLWVVTLGMALSWVIVRNPRFIARNVAMEGPLPLGEVRRAPATRILAPSRTPR